MVEFIWRSPVPVSTYSMRLVSYTYLLHTEPQEEVEFDNKIARPPAGDR